MGMRGSSRVLGRHVEVGAVIRDMGSSQHRSHKNFTATRLAAATAPSSPQRALVNTPLPAHHRGLSLEHSMRPFLIS